MFYERSDDYRPLFWAMGRPIYVNTLLLIGHILAFIVVALAVSVLGMGVESFLVLDTYAALHGQIWRLATYIIFTPEWAISFIFAMGFLFYFGRQVEEYVGRKTYAGLYASLVFVPAFLLCLLGLVWPTTTAYMTGGGGYGSIFGVFIAYATLYPGVEICIWFTTLTAKYWAYALLGVLTLFNLAYHQWVGLSLLWLDAALGYLIMRYVGAGRGFEWLTDWIEERRARQLALKHNIKVLEDKKEDDSIDAILDKISKHGVSSLNDRERAALEKARTNLIKRDQR